MPLTLEQELSIIGQIATWLTLLIILLTLLEMRAQRRLAYQPDLFPVDAITTIIVGGGHICTWQKYLGDIESIPEELDNFNVQIFNTGLGPAKNIQSTWSCNNEIFFQELPNKKFSIYYESLTINRGASDLISAISNDTNGQGIKIPDIFSRMGINITNEENDGVDEISTIRTIDYDGNELVHSFSHTYCLVQRTRVLLPSNDSKHYISLTLPPSYSMYFGLLLSTLDQEENGRSGDYLSRLNYQVFLKLDLDYEDIVGNKYSRKYKCNFIITSAFPNIEKHFIPVSGKLIFSENN